MHICPALIPNPDLTINALKKLKSNWASRSYRITAPKAVEGLVSQTAMPKKHMPI